MFKISHIIRLIVSMMLTPKCNICNQSVADDMCLCQSCWNKIKFINMKQHCVICYNIISQNAPNRTCAQCLLSKPSFDMIRSVCYYDGVIENLITAMKYNDKTLNAIICAKIILQKYRNEIEKADIICAVPMHKRDIVVRMYNQAALIARHICNEINQNNKFYPDLLIKHKRTKHQTGLSRAQRTYNPKNSISLNPKMKDMVQNKTILIIDDVITTGSTMSACSDPIRKVSLDTIIMCISVARTI